MVISNSMVTMAATQSYAARSSISHSTKFTPCIKVGNSFLSSLNYALDKNGNVKEAGDSTSSSLANANRKVRLQTLDYLLRMLLFGHMYGQDTSNPLSVLSDSMNSGDLVYVENTTTEEYYESQSFEYSATGTVVTEDGTEIEFNYSYSMTSSFYSKNQATVGSLQKFSNLIDPLIINLDYNVKPGDISDQKFLFDLDCDGEEEEISTLGKGIGFLALDKNGDGKINDGSELFGVKSGDGFKDLKAYDEDGNGWIDENDSIFNQLRVWTVNENGEAELYGLKEADVGAICLKRLFTNCGAYSSDNMELLGAVRASGIYLRESSGRAGCVQHLDLAI